MWGGLRKNAIPLSQGVSLHIWGLLGQFGLFEGALASVEISFFGGCLLLGLVDLIGCGHHYI